MTDRFIKLIQDNPDRVKGILEDVIVAYEEYVEDINQGLLSEDTKEKIRKVNSDIEFVKDLRRAIL